MITKEVDLPYEIINHIFDYVRMKIPVINKEDAVKKKEIQIKNSEIIKKWYNKYKIESRMPILFLDEIENFDKWYIIRLYMKFYPKPDLYDWPLYYLKRVNKQTPRMVSDYAPTDKESIFNYKYSEKAYNVFKFMQKINKNDIIKTGF